MDLMGLLQRIAVPRAGGSDALARVGSLISDFCSNAGLRVTEETYMLRDYMQGVVGISLAVLAVSALIFLARRKYWIVMVLALLIPAVYLLEFEANVPTASLLTASAGRNIIAEIGPASASRELIVSSHYDSKTELFDHRHRSPIYNGAVFSMVLLLAVAVWGLFGGRTASQALWRTWLCLSFVSVVGLTLLALSFGGGWMAKAKSPGARDNGTSVAVMLGLAEELGKNPGALKDTRVKLIFFSGEETNMQGSAAYVKSHEFPAGRTAVLNLETLAGPGPLRVHSASGTFLSKKPTDAAMVRRVKDAAGQIGIPVVPAGAIFDDSGRFLQAGIPAVTISHSEPDMPSSYHNTGDSIDKVVPGKMEETVRFLKLFIERYDEGL